MVETQRYPVCASLTKQVSLAMLAENIHNALLSGSVSEAPGNASTLLTPQEEKVLTMWMEGRVTTRLPVRSAFMAKRCTPTNVISA